MDTTFSIIEISSAVLSITVLIAVVAGAWWLRKRSQAVKGSMVAAPSKVEEDELNPAQKQLLLLRQYHAQGLEQSRISFWFSITFACLGFLVIAASIASTHVTAQRRLEMPSATARAEVQELEADRKDESSRVDEINQELLALSSTTLAPPTAELLASGQRAAALWRRVTNLYQLSSIEEGSSDQIDWADQFEKEPSVDWPIRAGIAIRQDDRFYLRKGDLIEIELPSLLERNSYRAERLEKWINQDGLPGMHDWADQAHASLTSSRTDLENLDPVLALRVDALLSKIVHFEKKLSGFGSDAKWGVVSIPSLTQNLLIDLQKIDGELSELSYDAAEIVGRSFQNESYKALADEIKTGQQLWLKYNEALRRKSEAELKEIRLREEREEVMGRKLDLDSRIKGIRERQSESEVAAQTNAPSIWQSQGALLGVIAGAIVEAVSGLFFALSNRARQLMAEFFDSLRADRRFDESLQLVGAIQDSTVRDSVRRSLALGLANVPDDSNMRAMTGTTPGTADSDNDTST